jgi:hypothetical protein
MKEVKLSEFEGTELEREIDYHLSQGGWNDIVFISPAGKVRRIEENLIEFFYRQKKDELDQWTKVVR